METVLWNQSRSGQGLVPGWPGAGWGQSLIEVKVSWDPWLFPPEETGVIGAKATVCLTCDALEVYCVPFGQAQHLIRFLLTLFHCMIVLLTLSIFAFRKTVCKMLYFQNKLVCMSY